MALLASSPVLVTQTFTSNTTWIATTSNIVTLSGFGARGADGGTKTTNSWVRNKYQYEYYRDGHYDKQYGGQDQTGTGATPSDYCDPIQYYSSSDPRYVDRIGLQYCYEYTGTSTVTTLPPTTGASATAFGKTFPGSTGNVAQTTTTFTNVAVTANASYSIVVPTGGSVTITYYQ